MFRALLASAVIACSAGCGKGPDSGSLDKGGAPAAKSSAQGVEAELYESIHSAHYHLEVAAVSVSGAYEQLQRILSASGKGERANALQEVNEYLDGVGEQVAELLAGPPTREQVRAEPARYQESRRRSKESVSDALTDLDSAIGIAQSLLDSSPSDSLTKLVDMLNGAKDDLQAVLSAYGSP